MKQFYSVVLTIIIYISSQSNVVSLDCRKLNEDCSKTVFSPCCDPLSCALSTAFNGKCKACLAGGYFCWRSDECCSGTCSWLKCTNPLTDIINKLTD
ncbi:hypothetical protein EWB00_004884 [Schistosoma japonicum]|uniref:Uncharacterized protein SJCHGC09766 n=2 Tax=Schistosoma japonicum TaxID=6182 RepID=SJ766_SCHJA|nr:RecName: Full=Uncharacterized protein SJCHGC09766; Flags: Precursor [Schistosoma japonicum]AAX31057.1 SJCHGC09766 protein [Schistosoma japonicum]TNN20186.1 hypothetical protein EWB00_004884 [Schistosoma japonicum]CAX70674.1 hypothetical protein [Schistosoma japonicum]CAX75645.1 hypothetical protein [Schistosoma japonicum]CAX75646.1 hypothetical protein [Schistosoma japonicum]